MAIATIVLLGVTWWMAALTKVSAKATELATQTLVQQEAARQAREDRQQQRQIAEFRWLGTMFWNILAPALRPHSIPAMHFKQVEMWTQEQATAFEKGLNDVSFASAEDSIQLAMSLRWLRDAADVVKKHYQFYADPKVFADGEHHLERVRRILPIALGIPLPPEDSPTSLKG